MADGAAKRFLLSTIRGVVHVVAFIFRSASHNPSFLGLVMLLLAFYMLFPRMFALLLSSSPVAICTALLLGILLSFGNREAAGTGQDKEARGVSSSRAGTGEDKKVREVGTGEDKKIRDVSLPRATRSTGDLLVKRDKRVREVGTGTGTVQDNKVREVSLSRATSSPGDLLVKRDESFVAAATIKETDPTGETRGPLAGSLVDGGDREIQGEEKGKSSVEKKLETGLKTEGLRVHTGTLDDKFDSSLGSPWHAIGKEEALSDTDTDREESSSAGTSMNEFIPMLDELHPLLDMEAARPALKSVDSSDASTDDNSIIGEEEELEDDEDEEAHEEKDDGHDEVVRWTADDQKNLMDLGTSEMERNRRLENVIARRSASRSLIPEIPPDLIDLDVTDPLPNMAELSIPPMSVKSRNPFDTPYDPVVEVTIPGSAPSVIHPSQNPFDTLHDQVGQSGSSAADAFSLQNFVSVPQRDPFYRRFESFTLGAPFSGETWRENHGGRLRPYFAAERVGESGFPPLLSQLSDTRDSMVSSSCVSDTTSSSTVDQDEQKELLDEGAHQYGELLVAADHVPESFKEETESSEDVDSIDADHEHSQIDMGSARETEANVSMRPAEGFQAMERGVRVEEHGSVISDASKVEVIEDEFNESSSPSSEVNDNSSEHEISANIAPGRAEALSVSTESIHLPAVEEGDSDVQAPDPVYDTSPSAAEKSADEDMFHAGIEGLNSHSLSSDLQPDISEGDSSSRPTAKNISSGEVLESTYKKMALAGDELLVASSNLSPMDEIKARSSWISETGEDVIRVGLPEVNEDNAEPVKHENQKSVGAAPKSLSSVGLPEVNEDKARSSGISETGEDVIRVGLPEVNKDNAEPVKHENQKSVGAAPKSSSSVEVESSEGVHKEVSRGIGGLDSSSSLSSDTQPDISEGDSPSRPTAKNIPSTEDLESKNKQIAFATDELLVASSNSSPLDEIKDRTSAMSETREDVIQVGLPEVNADNAEPVKLENQKSVGAAPASLSSVEAESSEDVHRAVSRGTGGLDSSSSLSSDMQPDISEGDSPSRPTAKNIPSTEDLESKNKKLTFTTDELLVASSNSSPMDEIKTRSSGISETREDVIQVGLPEVNADNAEPVKLENQKSVGAAPSSKIREDVIEVGLPEVNADNAEAVKLENQKSVDAAPGSLSSVEAESSEDVHKAVGRGTDESSSTSFQNS